MCTHTITPNPDCPECNPIIDEYDLIEKVIVWADINNLPKDSCFCEECELARMGRTLSTFLGY